MLRNPLLSAATLAFAALPLLAQGNPDIVEPGLTFPCTPSAQQWYRTDRTLAIDPANNQVLYVNVEYKGFHKSTDGGKTWSILTNGIKAYGRDSDPNTPCYGEYPVALVDSANPNRVLLATSGTNGTLETSRTKAGGIFESLDGGKSFRQLIQPWMNVYVTGAMTLQPGNSATLLYGTSSAPASYLEADPNRIFVTKGLVYQTKDSGANWTELPTGFVPAAGATGIFADRGTRLLVTTYVADRVETGRQVDPARQMGALRSTDGGATWQKLTGLPATYSAVITGTQSPQKLTNLFLISQAPADAQPRSYYTTDFGDTFQPSGRYLDVAAYDPLDPTGNRLLGYTWQSLSGPPARTLFESTDAGATWKAWGKIPDEITDVTDVRQRLSNIVFDPKDRSVVYLSGAAGRVWRTSDSGASWQLLLDYTKLPDYKWSGASPQLTTISNAADFSANIAPNTWVAIQGKNLATATRSWAAGDFDGPRLPAQLEKVQVLFNGRPGYVSYVSPDQVNVLVPAAAIEATQNVQLISNNAISNRLTVNMRQSAPSPFTWGADKGKNYLVATHLDYSLVGSATLYPGAATPAKPGETVLFYLNGMGPTNPQIPDGTVPSGLLRVSPIVEVEIGGTKIGGLDVYLVAAGLYQVAVKLPTTLQDGDLPVYISMNPGGASDGRATLAVAR